jgi:hypothetical protein
MLIGIYRHNVGRIAERIVSNELEYRGFRVSDLNKEGTSANADLLAVSEWKTWQIQVKGATEDNGWWVNYGYCNDAVIAKTQHMFNHSSQSNFYHAEIVVLVAVKSPNEYCYVALPAKIAEEAAQQNIDREYRIPRRDGQPKKPGPVWVPLYDVSYIKDVSKRDSIQAEQRILEPFKNNWCALG